MPAARIQTTIRSGFRRKAGRQPQGGPLGQDDQKDGRHRQTEGSRSPRTHEDRGCVQGQGSDGFFLASQVKPFWLELSAVLRRLRLDTLLRILPGVSAHPDRPATPGVGDGRG